MSSEEQKKEFSSALHRAVGLLARREHSAEELKVKLNQKGFDSMAIEQVIVRLQSENLQSDDRYAEAFVNERKRRGHGPVKIQYELKNKGVSIKLIEAYVDPQSYEWTEIAQLQYQKKYVKEEVNNYNEWTKRARFLQGRGFTSLQIRASVIFINEVD